MHRVLVVERRWRQRRRANQTDTATAPCRATDLVDRAGPPRGVRQPEHRPGPIRPCSCGHRLRSGACPPDPLRGARASGRRRECQRTGGGAVRPRRRPRPRCARRLGRADADTVPPVAPPVGGVDGDPQHAAARPGRRRRWRRPSDQLEQQRAARPSPRAGPGRGHAQRTVPTTNVIGIAAASTFCSALRAPAPGPSPVRSATSRTGQWPSSPPQGAPQHVLPSRRRWGCRTPALAPHHRLLPRAPDAARHGG